jgi:hypothetical protein
MNAVARKMEKQKKEHAVLRYFHEQEVAKQDLKDAGVQDKSSRLFGYDFMDSDTEVGLWGERWRRGVRVGGRRLGLNYVINRWGAV